MYCLKCRCVTETENITTAMSKNGRLMRRSPYITGRKIKTQFNKRDAAGGSFLNTLVGRNSLSKSICQVERDRSGNKIL